MFSLTLRPKGLARLNSTPGDMQPEELATLLRQNLALSSQPRQEPLQQRQACHETKGTEPRPIWTSAHYTHSSHQAREPTPWAPEPDPAFDTAMKARTTLLSHGLDPARLSASQIDLFESSAPTDQMSLIQLWLPQLNVPSPNAVYYGLAELDQGKMLLEWSVERTDSATSVPKPRYLVCMEVPKEVMQDMTRSISTEMGDNSAAEPYIAHGYGTLAEIDGGQDFPPK